MRLLFSVPILWKRAVNKHQTISQTGRGKRTRNKLGKKTAKKRDTVAIVSSKQVNRQKTAQVQGIFS